MIARARGDGRRFKMIYIAIPRRTDHGPEKQTTVLYRMSFPPHLLRYRLRPASQKLIAITAVVEQNTIKKHFAKRIPYNILSKRSIFVVHPRAAYRVNTVSGRSGDRVWSGAEWDRTRAVIRRGYPPITLAWRERVFPNHSIRTKN